MERRRGEHSAFALRRAVLWQGVLDDAERLSSMSLWRMSNFSDSRIFALIMGCVGVLSVDELAS